MAAVFCVVWLVGGGFRFFGCVGCSEPAVWLAAGFLVWLLRPGLFGFGCWLVWILVLLSGVCLMVILGAMVLMVVVVGLYYSFGRC